MIDMIEFFEQKKQEILTKRIQLSESEYNERSEQGFQRMIHSTFFLQAQHILLFFSKRSAKEIDTTKILRWALENTNHKKISLPKTDLKEKKLRTYEIKNLDQDLEAGPYRIMEPKIERCKETTYSEEIDLIIVPGTLFDKYGGRWGYGVGYYDRFLAEFQKRNEERGKPMPIILGFAFNFQIIEGKLPQKPSDIRINGLISDKREIYDRT